MEFFGVRSARGRSGQKSKSFRVVQSGTESTGAVQYDVSYDQTKACFQGRLRTTPGNSGQLWVTLDNYRRLRMTPNDSERLQLRALNLQKKNTHTLYHTRIGKANKTAWRMHKHRERERLYLLPRTRWHHSERCNRARRRILFVCLLEERSPFFPQQSRSQVVTKVWTIHTHTRPTPSAAFGPKGSVAEGGRRWDRSSCARTLSGKVFALGSPNLSHVCE